MAEDRPINRRDALRSMGTVGIGILGGGDTLFQYGHEAYEGVTRYDNEQLEEIDPHPLSDASEEDDKIRLAILPDTQKYVHDEDLLQNIEDVHNEDRFRHLEAQIDYINDHADELDLVAHEGDLVHRYTEREWNLIEETVGQIDKSIPQGIANGNHDWPENGNKRSASSGITPEKYVELFGEHQFEDEEWYVESGPDQISSLQKFSANGNDFLNFTLECEPRDETIEWAEGHLEDNPDAAAFVTTHIYLNDQIMLNDRTKWVREENGLGKSGEELYEEFIRPNEQIAMVNSGHIFGEGPEDGEYDQVSANEAGQPVVEKLTNFQGREEGGNGYMLFITLEPGEGRSEYPDRVKFETYSPSLDEYQKDSRSDFSYELDFEEWLNYER